MFGSPKGSRNFNLGDHLLGLGTQAKTPGSPRGSLKFSLEHSLECTQEPMSRSMQLHYISVTAFS